MDFKEAYLKLGLEKTKLTGKSITDKTSNQKYKVSHLYINIKNPTEEELKKIEELKVEIEDSIDPEKYKFLKDKDCEIFVKLKNPKKKLEKNISIDNIDSYHTIKN